MLGPGEWQRKASQYFAFHGHWLQQVRCTVYRGEHSCCVQWLQCLSSHAFATAKDGLILRTTSDGPTYYTPKLGTQTSGLLASSQNLGNEETTRLTPSRLHTSLASKSHRILLWSRQRQILDLNDLDILFSRCRIASEQNSLMNRLASSKYPRPAKGCTNIS